MKVAVIVRMQAAMVVRMSRRTLKTGSKEWQLLVKMDVCAFLQFLTSNWV
jgi:hypothetical protein